MLRSMLFPTRASPFSSVSPSTSMVKSRSVTLLPIALRSVTFPFPAVVSVRFWLFVAVPSILPVTSIP